MLNAFEKHFQVDNIYPDFSKAFDRANNKLLVAKLQAIELSDQIL